MIENDRRHIQDMLVTEIPPPLRSALAYAGLGWHVLPLHAPTEGAICSCGTKHCSSAGKHPRTAHGVLDASSDPSMITTWLRKWPGANIGVACGPSGMIVLDVDSRHGGYDSLRALVDRYGCDILNTVTSYTGGGGLHLVFKLPAGSQDITNGVSKLGPGIDIRAAGGYIVVPPSRHARGRAYVWKGGHGPAERPAAPLPDSLSAHLRPKLCQTVTGKLVDSRLRNLVLNGVGEGERNQTLASLVGHLFRKWVDPEIVVGLALAWAECRCFPALPRSEVMRVVDSIARREARRRRGGFDG